MFTLEAEMILISSLLFSWIFWKRMLPRLLMQPGEENTIL